MKMQQQQIGEESSFPQRTGKNPCCQQLLKKVREQKQLDTLLCPCCDELLDPI
jgi:hypothetical protein